jgi:hypothetical protein
MEEASALANKVGILAGRMLGKKLRHIPGHFF